jgi:hypothetical protein
LPEIPVVLFALSRGGKLSTWMTDVLRVVKVANPVWVVEEPVYFDSIVVPSCGFVVHWTFLAHHAQFLANYEAGVSDGRRVWLSRSSLGGRRMTFANETELEACLAASGWTMFVPETHSVPEQLEMLGRAEHIAGVEGSAFHSLVLLKHIRAVVSIVSRRGGRSWRGGPTINPNYITIAETRGIKQDVLATSPVATGPGGQRRLVLRKIELRRIAAALDRRDRWST